MLKNKPLHGFALAGLGLLALTGCDSLRVEFPGVLNGKNPSGFRCESNDDCLNGYRCVRDGSLPVGVCSPVGIGRECSQYNLDGDQYLAVGAPEECFGEATDCDDNDPNTYPGAIELCDGMDNNCDGVIDEDLDSIPCSLQIGVCSGAVSSCSAGAVVDCAESGAYAAAAAANGLVYSETEICGDGVDNNCDGVIDEGCCDPSLPASGPGSGSNAQCMCVPGQAFACGRDTGTCERGIRLCDTSVQIDQLPCMAAEVGDLGACTAPGEKHDTMDDVFCVREFIRPLESLTDTCVNTNDAGCTRTVYRRLASGSGVSCASSSDCASGETCAAGSCRYGAIDVAPEVCNGLDDDCDGSPDNHHTTLAASACGACPFNSVLMEVGTTLTPAASPTFQCVDIYEASRPDATATNAGTDERFATSAPGVLPWAGISGAEALAACKGDELRSQVASGDRQRVLPPRVLCNQATWPQACSAQSMVGVSNANQLRKFPYGNTYTAGLCNDGNPTPGSVAPTGDFDGCANTIALPGVTDASVKLFDMVGNLREWVAATTALAQSVRGGGFNDGAGTSGCATTVRVDPGQPIIFPYSRVTCAGDGDCGAGAVCNTAGGANVCVMACTNSACGGTCSGAMCTYPAVGGDWSDFDDVGFRCCSGPLQ